MKPMKKIMNIKYLNGFPKALFIFIEKKDSIPLKRKRVIKLKATL